MDNTGGWKHHLIIICLIGRWNDGSYDWLTRSRSPCTCPGTCCARPARPRAGRTSARSGRGTRGTACARHGSPPRAPRSRCPRPGCYCGEQIITHLLSLSKYLLQHTLQFIYCKIEVCNSSFLRDEGLVGGGGDLVGGGGGGDGARAG